MFAVDDKVNTPIGMGYVDYVEDGYIEVTVGGVEHSFEAPFDGVRPYVADDAEAHKSLTGRRDETTPSEIAAYDNIITNRPAMVAMGKAYWITGSMAASALGGSAAGWPDLSIRQKLNYIALATPGKFADDLVKEFA